VGQSKKEVLLVNGHKQGYHGNFPHIKVVLVFLAIFGKEYIVFLVHNCWRLKTHERGGNMYTRGNATCGSLPNSARW
jgi:hypothetical protein